MFLNECFSACGRGRTAAAFSLAGLVEEVYLAQEGWRDQSHAEGGELTTLELLENCAFTKSINSSRRSAASVPDQRP